MPLAALGMALLTSRRLHLQRHRRAVGPAVHSTTSPPTPLAKLPLMQPSTRRSSLHAQPERAAQPGLRIARHRRPSAPRSAADWPHSSRRCCGRCGAGSRCAPQRAEHARRRGRLLLGSQLQEAPERGGVVAGMEEQRAAELARGAHDGAHDERRQPGGAERRRGRQPGGAEHGRARAKAKVDWAAVHERAQHGAVHSRTEGAFESCGHRCWRRRGRLREGRRRIHRRSDRR